MKRHHKTILNTSIVIAILSLGYFLVMYDMIYSSSAEVEQKANLTIYHTNKNIDLVSDSDFWLGIDPERIHLYPQSARAPYGNSEKELQVRAVYNRDEVAFFIEFKDETEDLGSPVNPDACAILFAAADVPATAQMMGYESEANVWQWLADRNTQKYSKGNLTIKPVRELIATGPGTQTPLPEQNVKGKGIYENGKWSVIFKRSLASSQDGELQFRPETDLNIAFALWNGSKMESFSRKSISILRTLNWENE